MFRLAFILFMSTFIFCSTMSIAQETQQHSSSEEKLHNLAILLQKELQRVGCAPGEIDGHWGYNSRIALRKYNKYAYQDLSAKLPTQEAIDNIKSRKQLVCPVTCKENQTIQNGQCTPPPDPYDGIYQINGERIEHYKKNWCKKSFEIKLKIQGGHTTHKIPFGHHLTGEVRENKLYISSKPEKNNGHWIGIFALDNSEKELTTGIFKWSGDKTGATCTYQMIIKKAGLPHPN